MYIAHSTYANAYWTISHISTIDDALIYWLQNHNVNNQKENICRMERTTGFFFLFFFKSTFYFCGTMSIMTEWSLFSLYVWNWYCFTISPSTVLIYLFLSFSCRRFLLPFFATGALAHLRTCSDWKPKTTTVSDENIFARHFTYKNSISKTNDFKLNEFRFLYLVDTSKFWIWKIKTEENEEW